MRHTVCAYWVSCLLGSRAAAGAHNTAPRRKQLARLHAMDRATYRIGASPRIMGVLDRLRRRDISPFYSAPSKELIGHALWAQRLHGGRRCGHPANMRLRPAFPG